MTLYQGDSGIGRSAAVLFAKEGANVAIVHMEHEKEDAEVTKQAIEKQGRKCLLIPGDVTNSAFCKEAVEKTVKEFGKLTTLVNNAAVQYCQDSIEGITDEQLDKTFRTNIYAMFYMARSALPYLEKQPGSTIINTTSVTSYKGKEVLLDYSSTKGAITAFTRSLSQQLADKGIRVNAVAPGPIWTPLIPASFTEKQVEEFGQNAALGRPGQPIECGTCYVFLASRDSSYFTGQVLHPNGGSIVNG
jgi:NAD(P)-dependent dehydrogenase (short-subunit alcohol dehydrogenase family)